MVNNRLSIYKTKALAFDQFSKAEKQQNIVGDCCMAKGTKDRGWLLIQHRCLKRERVSPRTNFLDR